MTEEFKYRLLEKHRKCTDCPSNEVITDLFKDVMALLFPDFSNHKLSEYDHIDQKIYDIAGQLEDLVARHPTLCKDSPKEISLSFINKLESIESSLNLDISAIFEGDPAAKSKEEIIRSYPGFYAIAAYRIAHQLLNLGLNIVPRIITEHAHHRTGIDIHPAASIDHSFCIDHGTGVVIGETTIIGHHVKIYQGVTLGALSVKKVDANSKRHPTIESNVVVYANATVLGGETVIGHHSIIGGNVWITNSVEPHSTVYYISGSNQIQKNKQEV